MRRPPPAPKMPKVGRVKPAVGRTGVPLGEAEVGGVGEGVGVGVPPGADWQVELLVLEVKRQR